MAPPSIAYALLDFRAPPRPSSCMPTDASPDPDAQLRQTMRPHPRPSGREATDRTESLAIFSAIRGRWRGRESGAVFARRATAADLEGLWALEQSAFAGNRISPRSWRALIGSPSATVIVADDSTHALLGATVVLRSVRTRVARLYSLAVSPLAQRQGLGVCLLATAIAAAHAAGCSRLRLEVRSDNRAAQALYRRSGFVPIERKPAYYCDGADALCFELPLDSGFLPRELLNRTLP